MFENFPEGIVDIRGFRMCSNSSSDITSELEIAKGGTNLVSDRKVDFLDIWDVPWRISMATTRRGTFICIVSINWSCAFYQQNASSSVQPFSSRPDIVLIY